MKIFIDYTDGGCNLNLPTNTSRDDYFTQSATMPRLAWLLYKFGDYCQGYAWRYVTNQKDVVHPK